MKNTHIPSGEVGSVNHLTKKALTHPDRVINEIRGNKGLTMNIIRNLKQYAGADAALEFATKMVDDHIDFLPEFGNPR